MTPSTVQSSEGFSGSPRFVSPSCVFANVKLCKHPSSTGHDLSKEMLETREDYPMARFETACPFDAQGRANRCETCMPANSNVPPCVVAYLGNGVRIPASNVLPLHRVEVLSERKAA